MLNADHAFIKKAPSLNGTIIPMSTRTNEIINLFILISN